MQIKQNYHRWFLILCLAAWAFMAIGCQSAPQNVAAQDSSSETLTAFIGDLSATTGATGKIVAVRHADLMVNSSGEVTEIPVVVGDAVAANDVLVQLNSRELIRAVAQAEQNVLSLTSALADLQRPPTAAELTSAETAVSAAQANLDKLINGPTADDIAVSEANVQAAEANVWAASNRLNGVRNGATRADLQAAQVEVDEAQRQFDAAHSVYIAESECKLNAEGTHDCTLDRSQDGHEAVYWQAAEAQANLERTQAVLANLQDGNPGSLAVAQAGVSVAAAQRDTAVARHELLLAGATAADIAAAEAELAQANAHLIDLQDGPKPEQVAIAEAQLEQAKLSLAQAQYNLEQASLVAPFAGVVTAVNVHIGEQATGPVISLVDTNSMVLALKVNEIDLRHIALGQEAEVRLEAWPDQVLMGTIMMIAPENQPQATSNTIVYIVHLQLDQTELPLRFGMTGNADLILAERTNVLLLPNRAITTDLETGESFVNLVTTDGDSESIEQVPVTIGARSNQYSEILDGLQEGDSVRIVSAPPPTENDILE